MRSLASELRCAVLSVLVAREGVGSITDDDFAFLDAIKSYADSRQRPQPSTTVRGTAGVDITDEFKRKYEASLATQHQSYSDGPTPAPSTSGVAAAPQPTVDPGAEHDAAELLPIDRGPEPMDTGEVLDTAPTAEAAPLADDVMDPRETPPDYTKLPAIKGG